MGKPGRRLQSDMQQFGLGWEQWRWKEYLGNKGDRKHLVTNRMREEETKYQGWLTHTLLTCVTQSIVVPSMETWGILEEAWAVLLSEWEVENAKRVSTKLWDKKQNYPIVTGCPEFSKVMWVGHKILRFISLQMIEHTGIKRKTDEENKAETSLEEGQFGDERDCIRPWAERARKGEKLKSKLVLQRPKKYKEDLKRKSNSAGQLNADGVGVRLWCFLDLVTEQRSQVTLTRTI